MSGWRARGVYWHPVYAVLEEHFELIVGNARHIRNVPGRKADVKDSEWIADLVRHGLIAESFVPPRPLRELRELLRYRRNLVESQAADRNRLLKLQETAGIFRCPGCP
jgi:transposase